MIKIQNTKRINQRKEEKIFKFIYFVYAFIKLFEIQEECIKIK